MAHQQALKGTTLIFLIALSWISIIRSEESAGDVTELTYDDTAPDDEIPSVMDVADIDAVADEESAAIVESIEHNESDVKLLERKNADTRERVRELLAMDLQLSVENISDAMITEEMAEARSTKSIIQWPDWKVTYLIQDTGGYSKQQRDHVREMIREFNAKSCVKFCAGKRWSDITVYGFVMIQAQTGGQNECGSRLGKDISKIIMEIPPDGDTVLYNIQPLYYNVSCFARGSSAFHNLLFNVVGVNTKPGATFSDNMNTLRHIYNCPEDVQKWPKVTCPQ